MMTVIATRSSLEQDLLYAQTLHDWAAQVPLLFALADLAAAEDEHNLAQGFYGQAWAAAEQAGDLSSVARAMRGVGAFAPRGEIDLALWHEPILTLSLEIGDRVSQAETYSAMGAFARTRQIVGGLHLLAFACYDATGEIPASFQTPKGVSEAMGNSLRNLRVRELKYQAMSRYHARGDTLCEAHIYLAFGEAAFWVKDYVSAHEDFESARQLFQAMGNQARVKHVLLRTMRLAHRTHDYELYKDAHGQAVALFNGQPKTEDLMTLWLELAVIAADYQDWHTARRAYQGALLVTLSLGDTARQGRIYWQWGEAEYRAGHRSMGLALCQWGVVLIEHYGIDQTANYQRELKQMRKEQTA